MPTKYGTKDELKAAIDECHKHGMKIYLDAVLNHKAGGDETEVFKAVAVADDDRHREIEEPHDIEAYTKFTFPARQKKYSDFEWHHFHFSGTDWDARGNRKVIFVHCPHACIALVSGPIWCQKSNLLSCTHIV